MLTISMLAYYMLKYTLKRATAMIAGAHFSVYRILAVISAALINSSLAIIGGVLIPECVFP